MTAQVLKQAVYALRNSNHCIVKYIATILLKEDLKLSIYTKK